MKKDPMLSAIVKIFMALGVLLIISVILIYIYANQEVKPSFYLVLIGSAILNFIIAIYLNRKNKKNN